MNEYDLAKIADVSVLARSIVCGEEKISGSDIVCGMSACPFHQWTQITAKLGAVDSICLLPGDGSNVLAYAPFDDEERNIRVGEGEHRVLCNRRLPRCLKVKPLPHDAKWR